LRVQEWNNPGIEPLEEFKAQIRQPDIDEFEQRDNEEERDFGFYAYAQMKWLEDDTNTIKKNS
jgi:hypothetical protein